MSDPLPGDTEWRQVEESIQKRLSSWKGKYLSTGGPLVLISSVLTNMVLIDFPFSWHLKVSYKGLIIIGTDFIGKVINKIKSIIYPNGMSYVAQKIKGA